jgi:exonuclease SbcC
VRPLVLTMRAFGPYAEEETVDFRALGDRSLFLIHGATGAGKTSILDAMTYALYGVTSGAEREARHMLSDHAAESATTEVVFDFALGSASYRIARRPQQERAKRRGAGTTTEPPSVTLWRRLPGAEEREGTLLASKEGAVAERIESLLGLTASEFRQVVVLPQGRFRELLAARSAERERILATLFRTHHYREMQEELKRTRLTLESEARELGARIDDVLADARAADFESLCAMQREEQDARDRAEQEKESTRKIFDAARAARVEGTALTRRLDELEAAKRALVLLETRRHEHAARVERLARARKAEPLRALERAAAGAVAERDHAAEALENVEKRLADTAVALACATERWTEEKAGEGIRGAARREIEDLRRLEPEVDRLASARAQAEATRQRCEELERRAADVRSRIEALERALAEATPRARALLEVAARIEAHQGAIDRATALLSRRRELTAQAARVAEMRGARDAGQAQLERAELEAAAARERLDDLMHASDEAKAASLARNLEPGTPCPVCGSTEHPRLSGSSLAVPSPEQVEKARADWVALQEAVRVARERAAAADTEHARADATADALRCALGEAAGRAVDDLARDVEASRRALEAAKRSQAEAAELTARIETAGCELAAARREGAETEQARPSAAAEAAEAKSKVVAIEQRCPQGVRTVEALRAAIVEATERSAALERAWADAVASKTEAEDEQRRAREDVERHRVELEKKTRVAAEARAELRDAMLAAGFEEAESVGDALLSAAELDHLESEIERFKETWSAAIANRDRLERETSGATRPDLAVLEQTASEAEQRFTHALSAHAALVASLDQRANLIARVGELRKRRELLEQRYGGVGRIADLADGRNELGIPFHRFVLSALLDLVLAAASERLRTMSHGRYTLERSVERGSKRTTTGLDLEVFDAYTGTSRAVATLSGGESFLASLALALGLADVVQAEAGGVRLESVFVDEGFGSLDTEALDLAMRALVDLQRGGRLVGVISHVPEMRERIATRLEVLRGRNGSTTRLVVG